LLERNISSSEKRKPGCKPTGECFFLKPRHLGFYAGVPALPRVPWRLQEAAEFAAGPELHYEPSGNRSGLFSSGAKTPVNPALGLSPSRWCGRAGRLAAGLGACFHWLWSI